MFILAILKLTLQSCCAFLNKEHYGHKHTSVYYVFVLQYHDSLNNICNVKSEHPAPFKSTLARHLCGVVISFS